MFPGDYVVSLSARIPAVTSSREIKTPVFNDFLDSDFEEAQICKHPKVESKLPRSRSGLVFVRRPKNLDLRYQISCSSSLTDVTRSKALLLKKKLFTLRDICSVSNHGNMETTSELIATTLPYYRYFFWTPRQFQWSHALKSCLQSIFQNAHYPNNTTIEDDEIDLQEEIDHKKVASVQSHVHPVHSPHIIPSAVPSREIAIEEIESFSD